MRSGSHSHTCALRRAELGSSQQRGGGTRTLRACFWTVTDDRTYEPGSVRPSCSSEHTHGQVKDLHLRPPRPLEMFLLSPVRLTLFLLVFLDVAHPSLQGRSKGRWNKGGRAVILAAAPGEDSLMLIRSPWVSQALQTLAFKESPVLRVSP
ncbi:roundabout -like protein [Labeo rohita]|uniref:Roundabout-like protein n=1 Tax=Labeo rohita TaxID=84645 RepID=A0A498MM43_LABRO|nr:roundabout -like protein [Labeo rohita]